MSDYRLTELAQDDLLALADFIARDNVGAAHRVVDLLMQSRPQDATEVYRSPPRVPDSGNGRAPASALAGSQDRNSEGWDETDPILKASR